MALVRFLGAAQRHVVDQGDLVRKYGLEIHQGRHVDVDGEVGGLAGGVGQGNGPALGDNALDGRSAAAHSGGDENLIVRQTDHIAAGVHGAGNHRGQDFVQRNTGSHGQEAGLHPLLAQAVGQSGVGGGAGGKHSLERVQTAESHQIAGVHAVGDGGGGAGVGPVRALKALI